MEKRKLVAVIGGIGLADLFASEEVEIVYTEASHHHTFDDEWDEALMEDAA